MALARQGAVLLVKTCWFGHGNHFQKNDFMGGIRGRRENVWLDSFGVRGFQTLGICLAS